MKVKVPVIVLNEVNIEPGTPVKVGLKSINWVRKTLIVKKVVETKYGTYVVFDNHTWRPTRTYGQTWWKA